jgi:peptidoglycan/LPS O-acetylase OafA/YrhL
VASPARARAPGLDDASAIIAPISRQYAWQRALRALFVRPPEATKIAALDGARAIAVLVVVIHHAWLSRCGLFRHDCAPDVTGEPLSVYALGLIVGHGDLGVDIFFVLSGYLIFSVLYRWFERQDRSPARTIWRFIARRFVRIYPALAVMIPLNMLFFSFVPGVGAGADAILSGCQARGWTNYLLIQNVAAWGGTVLDMRDGNLSCMPWTWSIAVEWQFYLLSPFLVWRYATVQARARARGEQPRWWRGSMPACALFVLCLAGRMIGTLSLGLDEPGITEAQMGEYMLWLYANPLTRCTAYLLGMAAAAYSLAAASSAPRAATLGTAPDGEPTPERGRWMTRACAVTVLTFFIVGVLPYYPWPEFNLMLATFGRTLFSAAVAGLLIAGAAPVGSASRVVRLLQHRAWHPLALASYSVYLWQFVGIEGARWVFIELGMQPYQSPAIWAAFAALAIVASFAIGAASYLLVERPALEIRPPA